MLKDKLIKNKGSREIEDMVEDAFPNHLHKQDFIFTRLHSNITARLFHESHYQIKADEKKIIPIKKSGTN